MSHLKPMLAGRHEWDPRFTSPVGSCRQVRIHQSDFGIFERRSCIGVGNSSYDY
jgi:hypothetical protein